MKNFLIISSLLLITLDGFGQYATFSADTTLVKKWFSNTDTLPKQVTDKEWIINGQKLTFGSTPIQIKPNPNKLDTILFKGYRRLKYDTIICNISKPTDYQFVHNTCCGAFNLRNMSSNKYLEGKVVFKLSSNQLSKKYLGTLGEAGMMVKTTNENTLTVNCRSAMSNNIYKVTFSEIEECKDSLDCKEGTCLVDNKKEEPIWGYGYKTLSNKVSFLYVPLDDNPFTIVYDPKTDKIELK
jgi:hypothetical protein